MKESKELRLGDSIIGVDGKEYKVDLPTLDYIANGGKGIKPIPPTKEEELNIEG